MTSPVPGSTLNCGDVEFSWDELGSPPNYKWQLQIGTTDGGEDIYFSGDLGNSTSVIVSGIPEDGNPVYLTLWYQVDKNPWQYEQFTYTAASNCSGGPVDGVNPSVNSWSQVLTAADRFELVMGGVAVLDRETGLVWERSPQAATRTWSGAISNCMQRSIGGRYGWHIPSVEELASLKDPENTNPALPTGHPFDTNTVQPALYWSSTTTAYDTLSAYGVHFNSDYNHSDAKNQFHNVWCVRGGHTQDGYQ
ncbi:MAG: DUF1566 domain-containing protein [Planctomycetes bacterium]|nr:DUF1566 domain-containing protein [Planctomycetota bacterium]